MFYIFLAEGFEEIEALATIDILRRANVPILSVGVTGTEIEGAHGIVVKSDISLDEVEPDKMEGIILPGGMPGTKYLDENTRLSSLIDFAVENGLWLFAICAAPLILGKKGLLRNKVATCYPGFEEYLQGAIIQKKVCVDNNIITAQGPGVALDFAYEIIKILGINADAIKKEMQYE